MARKIPSKNKKLLKKVHRLSFAQLFLFAVIFAAVGGALIWRSYAAPHNGGGKGGGTLTGPTLVTDKNSDGLPNRGDSITFNVSTTATTTPFVGVRCYQDGAFIYDDYVGYFTGGYWTNQWFSLDSGYWKDGVVAKCTARLFYNDKRGNQIVLATLDFNVNP